MSINFSDDNRAEPREERYRGDEETLLSTNLLPDDDGEGSLRPRTLDEYIGTCPFSLRAPSGATSLWTT